MVLWLMLLVIAFLSDQTEAERFEAGMVAVSAGVPAGVELSGTVNRAVVNGDNKVIGYVVNGFRGDTDVLCRAVLATGVVECIDLPVNWLSSDDGWE